jgi:hypothetical protein
MANFTFSAATTQTEKKAEGTAKSEPQAYIFIGRDKYRATDKRSPQDWRKLFVCLSRMARNDGKEVSQNEFGLGIVYDALEVMEAAARKGLGANYDAAMEKHWQDALAEDAKRAEQAAKRAAEKTKADETDVEEKLTQSVATTPKRRK